MKIVAWIVGILIALAGLGAWLGPRVAERVQASMPQQAATEVRIEPVTRGDLVERVSAPGQVEPKTHVELSARISARIEELPYKEGDVVTKGDPDADPPVPPSLLVRLDSSDLEASLRAAEARRAADAARLEVARKQIEAQRANIDGIRALLAQAQLDLERKVGLLQTNDIAQSVVDEIEAAVKEQQARLEAAEATLRADELNLVVMEHMLDVSDAEIERARDLLNDTTIYSPIDGVVTRLNAEVGEMVITGTMNNPGTVILEVADLSAMLLVAQVDEADIGAVEPGQRAWVRMNAYPGKVFTGVVETVALAHRTAADGSKYYETEILLDTQGQPIPTGLTADVEIETRRHPDVLKVPTQAVLARPVDSLPLPIREGNPDVDLTKTFAPVVYRFLDGKAVVTPVTIGASDVTHTVILSGVSEGDSIIVGPYKALESLAHDQAVKDERVAAQERLEAAQAAAEPAGADSESPPAAEEPAASSEG